MNSTEPFQTSAGKDLLEGGSNLDFGYYPRVVLLVIFVSF